MTPIVLTAGDLAVAALLVLASAAASLVLALDMHRSLLVAAARMVAQILLVGLALRAIFAIASPALTALLVGLMLAAAGYEVGARQRRRFAGLIHYGLGGGSVTIATLLITTLALTTSLRPTPWYDPRYAIPLTGMILGNVMNAASLALNAFLDGVARERPAIEARLALGADRRVALAPLMRQATRNGLIPVVNQMAAAGIITLPGTMTGQVLAGMDPVEAAKYQILLMFLLTGGCFLGVVLALRLAAWRLTDERHRLRLDRLVSR